MASTRKPARRSARALGSPASRARRRRPAPARSRRRASPAAPPAGASNSGWDRRFRSASDPVFDGCANELRCHRAPPVARVSPRSVDPRESARTEAWTLDRELAPSWLHACRPRRAAGCPKGAGRRSEEPARIADSIACDGRARLPESDLRARRRLRRRHGRDARAVRADQPRTTAACRASATRRWCSTAPT